MSDSKSSCVDKIADDCSESSASSKSSLEKLPELNRRSPSSNISLKKWIKDNCKDSDTESVMSASTDAQSFKTAPQSLRSRRRENSSEKSARLSTQPTRSPRRKKCCSCSCWLNAIKIILVTTSLIIVSLVVVGYNLVKPQLQCELNELSSNLYSNIYGQEVAIKKILNSLTDFCSGATDNDKLVLAFWGNTGVGKTSATTVLTNHFEANGHIMPSEFFKESSYKDWVKSRSSDKPFLYAVDDVASLDEIVAIKSSARSISFPLILVLSTSVESQLLNASFIESSSKGVTEFVYTGERPTWLSEMKDLDPVLVPFLPLSRATVKLCIEKALRNLKIKHKKDDVDKIASEYEYFNDGKLLFSTIGCKRVNDKILSVLSP